MKDKALFILLLFAFLTRFFYFNLPAEVVFDEVHFGKFVRAYFTHENYFDIHPPTGKLLIAGAAELLGFKIGEKDFSEIGQSYDASDLLAIRLLPSIISALFVGLIYLLTLRLTRSRLAAILAGAMILLDNALITQSRFGLLDIFLLFFGFLALYLYLVEEDFKKDHDKSRGLKEFFLSKRIFLCIAAGISLGLSYSIKWTGLSVAALIGILALYELLKNRLAREFFIKLAIIYIVSFLVYMAGFAIHFALLTKPGPGDAYLSQNFKQKPFVEKFVDINKAMYSYNAGIKTEHPFASRWYEWPLNQKAIFYWQENDVLAGTSPASRGTSQQIWLLGNPVIWYLGGLGILSGVILLLLILYSRVLKNIRIQEKLSGFSVPLISFLLIAWAINFFPFSGIDRPLFLYHYFFPLVFSIILVSYIIATTLKNIFLLKNQSILLARNGFTIVLLIGFLLVAPLTYGTSFVSKGAYQKMISVLL